MLRRLLAPTTVLALCFCGPASLAARAGAAPLRGLNISGPDYGLRSARADQAVAAARAMHAKVVRIEVPWSVLEPLGPGLIDPRPLAFTDRLVADAASAGIKVIMLADGTPCWASSAPASLQSACTPGRSSKANSWQPTEPGPYAAFVAYLAQRYGPHLAAIEIWNEPDQANEDYFAGPHKAQHYAELLKAAYPAIKQADPAVTVLAGSLVGSNGVFLRALYAAGIKGYYDGLAVHFYTLTLDALRETRQVQLANGDTKPLWLDEFGWSSCWPGRRTQQEQACVTADTQATNFRDLYRSLARTPYVAAEVFFKLQDSGGENFGVLTAHGARKPSWTALSHVFVSPLGSPSPVTLKLAARGGQVLASGSGPVGDVMQLEAFEHGILRYRASFTLDRFNRYSLALPRVLGSSGLQVRVWQQWAGLAKAARGSI